MTDKLTCLAEVGPRGINPGNVYEEGGEGFPSARCAKTAESTFELAQKVWDNKSRWKALAPEVAPSAFKKLSTADMHTIFIDFGIMVGGAYIALTDEASISTGQRDGIPDIMEIYIPGYDKRPNWLFIYRTAKFSGDQKTFKELFDKGIKSAQVGFDENSIKVLNPYWLK